jgi:hypothetical protein
MRSGSMAREGYEAISIVVDSEVVYVALNRLYGNRLETAKTGDDQTDAVGSHGERLGRLFVETHRSMKPNPTDES